MHGYALFKQPFKLSLLLTCLLFLQPLFADEIRIAVASNFTFAIKVLAQKFEAQSTHKTKLIFGATGRHYAQIKNGAPFDIFFSADSKRPELLEKQGLTVADSRFTYALGKLVLWSPKLGVTKSGAFYHIAMANPKLAPYGKAAQQVLQKQPAWWEQIKPKIVRGENIAQTFQFVKSGNAELGYVALSQVKHLDKNEQGSLEIIEESLYSPIEQQAVLLNNKAAAKEFLDFIKADEAQALIKGFGYGTKRQ